MATITSTTGLISGLEITDIVDSLMKIASQPKTNLESRNTLLTSRVTAMTSLEALLLAFEYSADQLQKSSLYSQKTASSSDTSVLTASVTGTPAVGTYTVQAVRAVSSQQYRSNGIKSNSASLGGGTVTVRYGRTVDEAQDLSVLGGGEGIVRGRIRITDRSGTTGVIDLSAVQTVDDVLTAINSQTTVQVQAMAYGDRIRLIDTSGEEIANLKVQEVGSGTTAASLGLSEINVAANEATGSDMIWLTEGINLSDLNDGNGVRFDTALEDIEYTLRDGTTGTIDLSPIISGGSTVDAEVTLGDVLEVLNAADPDKLSFSISAVDGKRLIATDLTEGEGDFTLESLYDSHAVEALGLTGESADGVITGSRLLSGMKTVLFSSLNGGEGFGQLGDIQLTDRSGATATVDLSEAETLDDVIKAINDAGLGITAQVNTAGNGIELIDSTGSTTSNLVVANGDATNTADLLQIAVNAATNSVNSGDLHLQVIGWNTRLSALNGGSGVNTGKFTITDSSGVTASINITSSIVTIGDVIKAINRSGLQIEADLNEAGDGIAIRDTADGSGTLKITDGTAGTAADLHLLQTATSTEEEGITVQTIDGRQTYAIELESEDSLADLSDLLNDLGIDIQASVVNDGSSNPYRLSVISETVGKLGNLVIDTSEVQGLNLEETVHGQDALMLVGSSSVADDNLLLSSSSNTFDDAVTGLRLTMKKASSSAVTVTVSTTQSNLTGTLQAIAEDYNDFRESLEEYTAYNADTSEASVLNCDPTAIRLENDLARFLSRSFTVPGTSITSLEQLGLSLADDGTLEFDSDKFAEIYTEDPDGVQTFLADADNGVSAQLHSLLEQLAGEEDSLLANRIVAIQETIDQNEDTITRMEEQLEIERERLLNQFYALEIIIAEMQSGLDVLDSIVYIHSDGSSKSDD